MLYFEDITPDQHGLIDALYAGNCLAVAPGGYGKAVCGQTAIQELLADGHIKRCIIFAPLKVCELTWKTEHEKWDHLEPVAMATGKPDARRAAIESDARIVVMNFDNLTWFFKEYPGGYDFDGVLFDELSKLKSPGSNMVKKARHALKSFNWRAGMSATPVAESGADIYSQALMIDGGKALGTRLDNFRMNYCMPLDYKQYKWGLQPGAAERIAGALKDVLFIADSAEYEASLPELRDRIWPVPMPEYAWAKYRDMAEELILDIGNTEVEAANMAVMTGKLQQIVQGFIYRGAGPDRISMAIHNSKLDTLTDILGDGRPTIVSYQYQHELRLLRARFPDMVVLADDPAEAEQAWNDGMLKVLAVHPASAGHGLNLQRCPGGNRLICMSPIWSADLWRQLLGRLRRRGQASDVVERIVLVTSGTIDDIVMDRLAGKEAAEENLMLHLRDVAKK